MPRQNTKPEVSLRRELHRRGLRFRIHVALPGRPDLAFTRARIAVFVDGCFWHACPDHGSMPKNNDLWWSQKLDANVARDRRKDAELVALGWFPVHVWEHEPVGEAAGRIEWLWQSRTPVLACRPGACPTVVRTFAHANSLPLTQDRVAARLRGRHVPVTTGEGATLHIGYNDAVERTLRAHGRAAELAQRTGCGPITHSARELTHTRTTRM